MVLLLVYGSWVFHIEPRIDTEIAINHPKSYFNWLGIGRQGLVFTEYIFGLRWFNPYAATVFGYILICAAGILFGYIFWRCNHAVPPIVSACFSLFYFSSPIFVEQFYYELQIFQMAWAFIICAVGVGLSYYGILRKDVVAKILSVLCMIWAFSSYQTFMILHVTAVALCYILLYRRWNEDTVCVSDSKKYWLILGWQILLFLCAVVANTAITNVFFSDSEYLSGKVLWGNELWFVYCSRVILGQIYRAYVGEGTFYTIIYGILSVWVLIATVLYLKKYKGMKLRWLYFCAVVFVQCCPFLLTIYMGDLPVIRAQFVYPFVMIGNIIVLLCYYRKEWMRSCIVLLALVMLWSQSKVSMRLIYTQDICEQEDARLAGYIEERIAQVSDVKKPIAFVGEYTNQLNAACVRGEVIGISYFGQGNGALEPHYWISTRTMLDKMHYESRKTFMKNHFFSKKTHNFYL